MVVEEGWRLREARALILLLVEKADAERVSSTGVPTPSVLMVSTLLARLRLLALEGARPRSWRLRRSFVGEGFGLVVVLGFVAAAKERAFWWWARRDEMVDERLGSRDGSLDGGSVVVVVVGFKGEVGFGGEELGEISRRGAESWGMGCGKVFESVGIGGWSCLSLCIVVISLRLKGPVSADFGLRSFISCVLGLEDFVIVADSICSVFEGLLSPLGCPLSSSLCSSVDGSGFTEHGCTR